MFLLQYFKRAGVWLSLSLCMAVSNIGSAQSPEVAGVVSSNTVGIIHLAGLPDVKSNTKGDLSLTPDALMFSNSDVRALIATNRITAVFTGDERAEKGGTTGQIARKVIPYGGGAALGAFSQKSVDLLTVEYRDEHEGYHGAIFELPTKQAAELQKKILAETAPLAAVRPQTCSAAGVKPDSILVEPIDIHGMEIPAEYRVLFYEHLLTELRRTQTSQTYFRTGDIAAGPGCTAFTLQVAVVNFQKGNQALRASTGPLGMFLGTTKIAFEVKLVDRHGETVVDTNLKKSNRRDSDSLNVVHAIAKSISKTLDKKMKKMPLSNSTA
jgi:hypothetical protein